MAKTAKTIKRAIVSVSNKEGVVDFCSFLIKEYGTEIISTGGTLKVLQKAKVRSTEISKFTGFPEMMDGRVKTLNPKVHGGILARRGFDEKEMQKNSILPIDLVVVNLYPFVETISKKDVTLKDAIENIDIGGSTMLRSAAKNNKFVCVIVDPEDYPFVKEEMKQNGGVISQETRRSLAIKAFTHTASYDSTISGYLSSLYDQGFPDRIFSKFQKKEVMRYGENPHQKAAFYIDYTKQGNGIGHAVQL